MITQEDLSWWLETADHAEWIWAKTYAETAPHSYLVEGRTTGLDHEDYVRAGRVIHTFGKPGKFYGKTSIYLTSPDGRLKWWTMASDVRDTGLINQATTERVYGVQNAPDTDSGVETRYDAIASSYDELNPMSESVSSELRSAVQHLAGDYPPALLDAGCGTGRALDLGLTSPDRYAGVDPSKPMLNQLVRKHPGVAAVYPMSVEDALERGLIRPCQFEIVTLVDAEGELTIGAVRGLEAIASRGVIVANAETVNIRSSVRRAAISR